MRCYNGHYKNTKDHKRLPRVTIWQLNGQPRRYGQILRKVQSPKNEPGRNIKY